MDVAILKHLSTLPFLLQDFFLSFWIYAIEAEIESSIPWKPDDNVIWSFQLLPYPTSYFIKFWVVFHNLF